MNFNVEWSEEDKEFVGTCEQYPSLSFLSPLASAALDGIRELARATRDELAVAGALTLLPKLSPALLVSAAQSCMLRWPDATLEKNGVGNLAVMLDGEYVGYIDLRTGEVCSTQG